MYDEFFVHQLSEGTLNILKGSLLLYLYLYLPHPSYHSYCFLWLITDGGVREGSESTIGTYKDGKFSYQPQVPAILLTLLTLFSFFSKKISLSGSLMRKSERGERERGRDRERWVGARRRRERERENEKMNL